MIVTHCFNINIDEAIAPFSLTTIEAVKLTDNNVFTLSDVERQNANN